MCGGMVGEKLWDREKMGGGRGGMGKRGKWVGGSEVGRGEFWMGRWMGMGEGLEGWVGRREERGYGKGSGSRLWRMRGRGSMRVDGRMVGGLCGRIMGMMKGMEKVEMMGRKGSMGGVVGWK